MKRGKQYEGYISGVDEYAAPFYGGKNTGKLKPGGRKKRSREGSVKSTRKGAGHGY